MSFKKIKNKNYTAAILSGFLKRHFEHLFLTVFYMSTRLEHFFGARIFIPYKSKLYELYER